MGSAPKEFTIRCITCNIDIVDIMDKHGETMTKVRARCPKCKDLSYYHKCSTEIGYIPCNNFRVVDIIEKDTIIIEVQ